MNFIESEKKDENLTNKEGKKWFNIHIISR